MQRVPTLARMVPIVSDYTEVTEHSTPVATKIPLSGRSIAEQLRGCFHENKAARGFVGCPPMKQIEQMAVVRHDTGVDRRMWPISVAGRDLLEAMRHEKAARPGSPEIHRTVGRSRRA